MTFNLADLNAEFEEVVGIHEAALAKTEGGGNSITPEGTALALITGYVELGNHTGKKANAKSNPKGILEMKLFDIEGEPAVYTRTKVNEDKTETIYGTPISHNFNNISQNDESYFRKDMVKLLDAAGITDPEKTSPIHLIGKHIMIDVIHNPDAGDDKKVWVNLDIEGCKQAFDCDRKGKPDLTKPLGIPVKASEQPLRAFVWDAPTPSYWASIEIEGTFDSKDKDGKVVEKSKNWLQERIQGADNFAGSAVESLLMQLGSSSAPLPKATKAKEATVPKEVKEDVKTDDTDVPVAETTHSTKEAPKEVETPDTDASEATSGLTDAEVVKLAQADKMIAMCVESGMDATQFETQRDELIAKRGA